MYDGLNGTGNILATLNLTPNAGSCGDDTGFFNYSDYEYSTLRMLSVLSMFCGVSPSRAAVGRS